MQKRNYEVEVLVNGHPVKEYYKDGSVYIEGRKGVRFSIRIKNNGYGRIFAIPTIDGLSVINGKDANYDSPGYIINGYNSLTIDGWRTSDSEIAEFYFSSQRDSYRKRIGKNGNLGVIGVAVFREKPTYSTGTTITIPCFPTYPNYPWVDHWVYPWCGSGTYGTIDSVGVTGNALSTQATSVQYDCSGVSSDLGTGFGEQKEAK